MPPITHRYALFIDYPTAFSTDHTTNNPHMSGIAGTKFFLTADPSQAYLEELLSEIYELYIDYALKNPFYDIEQPIQNVCEKFVANLETLIQTIQKGGAPKSVTISPQTTMSV